MIEFENISLDNLSEDGFSIVTEEVIDSAENSDEQISFPILAVRNTVMFPQVVIPITAGREKSIKLLQEAYETKQFIGVISQKNPAVEVPKVRDLNTIGTICRVIKIIKLPDGNITAITRGIQRFKVKEFTAVEPYFKAEIEKLNDSNPKNKEEFGALIANIKDLSIKIVELDPNIPNAANFAIKNIDIAENLLNFVCVNAHFSSFEKQKLLEEKVFRQGLKNAMNF